MNFVAYCHIFICICIIYNVISMYLDVFGDFPKDPHYFGYNSAGQENPVLCIFRLRDLYGLKLTRDFSRINIFQNMTMRDFGSKQTEQGRGIEQGWHAHPLGTPPVLLAASGLPSRPSKAPEGSLDLKTP